MIPTNNQYFQSKTHLLPVLHHLPKEYLPWLGLPCKYTEHIHLSMWSCCLFYWGSYSVWDICSKGTKKRITLLSCLVSLFTKADTYWLLVFRYMNGILRTSRCFSDGMGNMCSFCTLHHFSYILFMYLKLIGSNRGFHTYNERNFIHTYICNCCYC